MEFIPLCTVQSRNIVKFSAKQNIYFIRRYRLHRLVSFTNFNAQFLYSLTICMLHYNPRHVSSINVPIFRRANCIITASGIVTLCMYSMPDENRLSQPAFIRHTVQPFTESDDTRCCDNTICPPEDEHVDAPDVSRVVMYHTYC